MPKQLNVDLAFTADTSQAKSQIQDLQMTLKNLYSNTATFDGLPITKEIIEAQNAAKQLDTMLEEAFDVDTGKLDLLKFNQSLQESKMTLTDYSNKLTMFGNEGDQAFLKIAKAVVQTQAPMRQSNALLNEMWTTMKNTARWQISSSILHGFMGAIQSAMGYAKELDESLNNIRIVTGQTADQMSQFAISANRAAKALSTTTTDYTNAALIFYQQGLNDEEVAGRTEVTLKMANVAGESAQKVSDQLTAVWNNFYDGSQSLEHYADVMTALGAATASSTDEISQGLNKFAAVAETVGLSYEYAASALATVTSNTRQSADVVGTAFKTLFARIQDLELGETLEDGTTLGSYSEALAAVGVTIKDSNGELKAMDNILNEMAAKWKVLNDDQKVSLAQSVAGVRQYTQLIALMDSWDKGDEDSMVSNLKTSYGSTGTLDEQQEIYADSWAASSDRLKASAEGVYDSLINEEFFKSFNDNMAIALRGVEMFVDSIGGMKGTISLLVSLITSLFGQQLTTGINNALSNFKIFTGAASMEMEALQASAREAALEMTKGYESTPKTEALRQSIEDSYQNQKLLNEAIKKMSPEQAEAAKQAAEIAARYNEVAANAAEAAEEATRLRRETAKSYEDTVGKNVGRRAKTLAKSSENYSGDILKTQAKEMKAMAQNMGIDTTELTNALKARGEEAEGAIRTAMKNISKEIRMTASDFTKFEIELEKVNSLTGKTQPETFIDLASKIKSLRDSMDAGSAPTGDALVVQIKEFVAEAEKAGFPINNVKQALADYNTIMDNPASGEKEKASALNNLIHHFRTADISIDGMTASLKEQIASSLGLDTSIASVNEQLTKMVKAMLEDTAATKGFEAALDNAKNKNDQFRQGLENTGLAYKSLGGAITGITQGLSSFAMAINSIRGLFETLQNEDLTPLEKALQVMMSLAMITSGLSMGLKMVGDAKAYVLATTEAGLVAQLAEVFGLKTYNVELETNTGKEIKRNTVKIIATSLEDANRRALELHTGSTIADTTATEFNTKATIANMLAKFWWIGLIIVALGGLAWALSYAAKADERAVEKTKESIEAYKETKEQLDQLNDSLKTTKDRIQELESMESLSIVEEEELEALREEAELLEQKKQLQEDIIKDQREAAANNFEKSSESNITLFNDKRSDEAFDGQTGEYMSAQEFRERYIDADVNPYTGEEITPEMKQQREETYQKILKDEAKIREENLDEWVSNNEGFNAWVDQKTSEDPNFDFSSEEAQKILKNKQEVDKAYLGSKYDEMILDGEDANQAFEDSGYNLDKTVENAYANNKSKEEVQQLIENMIENDKDLSEELFRQGITAEEMAKHQTEKLTSNYEQAIDALGGEEAGSDALSNLMSNDRWNEGDLGYLSQIKGVDSKTPEEIFNEINELKRPQANQIASQIKSEAEKYDLDTDVVQAMREQIDTGTGLSESATNWLNELENTDVVEHAKTLNDLAMTQSRLSRGYDTLADNWEDWNSVMSDSTASADQVAEIMPEIEDAMADILDWDAKDVKLLPPDFAQKHWSEIQDVYDGVDGAVEKLQGLATQEQLIKLGVDTNNLDEDAKAAYDSLNSFLGDMPDLEVGMSLDDTGMMQAFQTLLDQGVITADQMNKILQGIGFEPEVKSTKIPVDNITMSRDGTEFTTEYVDAEGNLQYKTITADQYNEAKQTGYIEIPTINAKEIKYTGGGGIHLDPPSVRSSGSGSSKPKKADTVKKSDTVDRYKEINDSLENIQHTMDQNQKIADSLWGEDRFAKMRTNIKLLQSENKLLEEKKQLAEGYLAEDKAALERAAAAAGVSLAFDPDTGNIINYTEELTRLWAQQDSLIAQVNADGNVDEAEQEQLDAQQEKIDNLKDAISQYDDTLKEKLEIDSEYLDNQTEIWNQNFELLNEELELKISFNESDLEIIEYYLSKMEDDFFSMSEAYEILKTKGNEYEEMLGHQKEQYDKLTEAYNKGEISEANYKEGLKEIQSATIDNLESLIDLDREMMEYYGNTLDAAGEELSIYTDKMEHLNTVLDHYSSLMELFGKSTDYELMGSILETQADTLRDQLDVAQQNYQMLSAEAEQWKEKMDGALKDPEAYELYKKNWDAAQTAANEAQDEMLSKTQEWAEAMKAVVENELAGLGRTLEKTLTGGSSFDDILTSMERANSLQEEYLTATNKIYETDKLMRKAQQEIDKTQNSVAKRKLQAFINETDQLQSQTKLSQYELDIQEAKYELLLAEIALEEAQQAKSTVRLTRDSEGNFGYVYTADQNQIAEAEQKLADAQNNLYNIGLEGANEYNQKYIETMSEMQDTFAELHEQFLNGEIATQEEYNNKMLEAQEYYFNKLKDFSNLYQVALTTDSRVVRDAWSTDFDFMISDTANLQDAVMDYTDKTKGILTEWSGVIQQAMKDSGLDDTSAALKTIGDESDRLLNIILGSDGKKGLITALQDEITKVNELSGAYAGVREEINKLILDYENLIKTTNADYKPKEEIEGGEGAGSGETAGDTGPAAGSNTNSTPGSDISDTPALTEGSGVVVKTTATHFSRDEGNGTRMLSFVPGGSYEVLAVSGDEVLIGKGGARTGWVHKTDLVGFKSGGYTGSWGPYGKLGILDEKELILNEGDTANFLASMEVLERILSIIDLHTANAQLGGLLATPGYRDNNSNNQLEQNVHIEASFPGVQDRHEIEEAFNNLVNRASQYANRK